MFMVQDYRPDDSFGPQEALPEPKQYGVPAGWDIPIFQMFWWRDHEVIDMGRGQSVIRCRPSKMEVAR